MRRSSKSSQPATPKVPTTDTFTLHNETEMTNDQGERAALEEKLLEAGWKGGAQPEDVTQSGWYAAVDQVSKGDSASIVYQADIWLGRDWAFFKRLQDRQDGYTETRLMIKGPFNNKEGARFCFPES
jgi:hypothetical protein